MGIERHSLSSFFSFGLFPITPSPLVLCILSPHSLPAPANFTSSFTTAINLLSGLSRQVQLQPSLYIMTCPNHLCLRPS